jgi:hypothetical protein
MGHNLDRGSGSSNSHVIIPFPFNSSVTYFLVGKAAGQAILDGFNQEYEQFGDDW